MEIPNADRAIVDDAKLVDYCLNPDHFRGRHKARLFAAVLGLTANHADELRTALLEAVQTQDALATSQDEFGQRYVVDFTMQGPAGRAMVRSAWIVRADEDFPRLTSCYVL